MTGAWHEPLATAPRARGGRVARTSRYRAAGAWRARGTNLSLPRRGRVAGAWHEPLATAPRVQRGGKVLILAPRVTSAR